MTKPMTKFILIVVDEKEQIRYFGPFDDGEKALEWGEERFDDKYFLTSTTLYDPANKENKEKK